MCVARGYHGIPWLIDVEYVFFFGEFGENGSRVSVNVCVCDISQNDIADFYSCHEDDEK